jgi:hypothetical protein
MFLGQYVSSLMQETIAYLKLPCDKLAHEMSIPELVLRDAVEGKMGLTRGQWSGSFSARKILPIHQRRGHKTRPRFARVMTQRNGALALGQWCKSGAKVVCGEASRAKLQGLNRTTECVSSRLWQLRF